MARAARCMDDHLGANAAVRRVQCRIAVEPEIDDRSHADVTIPGEQEVGSGVVVGAACEVLDVDVADTRGRGTPAIPENPWMKLRPLLFADPP